MTRIQTSFRKQPTMASKKIFLRPIGQQAYRRELLETCLELNEQMIHCQSAKIRGILYVAQAVPGRASKTSFHALICATSLWTGSILHSPESPRREGNHGGVLLA